MEKIRIREDNRKLYKLIYIIIAAYACIIAYVNIMNTQNLIVLYILFGITLIFLISLIVFLIIKRKRSMVEVTYETHQLLFQK